MKLFPLTVSTCHHSGLDWDWLCSSVTICWFQSQTRYPGRLWSLSQPVTFTTVPSSPNLCYSEAHSPLEGGIQEGKIWVPFLVAERILTTFQRQWRCYMPTVPIFWFQKTEMLHPHRTQYSDFKRLILPGRDWGESVNGVIAFNFQRFSSF